MFPKSNRVVFRNNPLVEVICQLRFPTLLEISTSPPSDYQNLVRKYFPFYEREQQQAFPQEVAEIVKRLGPGVPSGFGTAQHQFANRDHTKTITLTDEFVAITDTKYERWESFWSSLKLAKDTLEQIYAPSFYTRIGLRYRNLIDLDDLGLASENWNDLISEQLLGLLDFEGVKDQVEGLKGEVTLAVPSVEDARLTLRHGMTQPRKFTIDADFYVGAQRDVESVESILTVFNELDGNLFRWAIKQRLFDALEPEQGSQG